MNWKHFVFYFLISFFSVSAFAGQQVCAWENKKGYGISTQGYTWGGGTFSTLQECGWVLRANLLSIDFFDDYNGSMLFVNKSGILTQCSIVVRQYPWISAPPAFRNLIFRAYDGKASAQELARFEWYLEANLQVVCH